MKRLLLIIPIALLLSACSLPFINKRAGIQVTSDPQGNVQINQESSGLAPLTRSDLKAGEYNIKIIPQDPTLQSWESRVSLTSGTMTVVDRHLAVSLTQSHGYILYFTKINQKDSTKLSITSIPNSISVLVDGQPSGFTPIFSDSIAPGSHTITFTAPGYQEKVITTNVESGHQLNIDVQLASQFIEAPLTPTPTATPSASPTPTSQPNTITPLPPQATTSALPKPYVEILSTPTGWLRVRQDATTSSTEIAKVNPGDQFPYLNTQSGWYQIQLTDQTGWISSTYAELFE